jgi:hypothetical protein
MAISIDEFKKAFTGRAGGPLPAPPGAAPTPPAGKRAQVKISKPVISVDEEAAKSKARNLADRIKSGKWQPKDEEELMHWLEFFEDKAWWSLVYEIRESVGEEVLGFEGESWAHPDGIYAVVAEENLVVPTSQPRVARGGFTVAYSAQIIEETSESTSVEVYTDMSGKVEVSAEIPLKVVKIKVGGEIKKGRKESEKTEEKRANRRGMTISRSFIAQLLERQVFHATYHKTYHGIGKSNDPLDPGRLANRVTREHKGTNPQTIQTGYQLVPKEGGKTWGPYWNIYRGNELL